MHLTPVCTVLDLLCDELGPTAVRDLQTTVDRALTQLTHAPGARTRTSGPADIHTGADSARTRAERAAGLPAGEQLLIWSWLWEQFAELVPSRFHLPPKRLGTQNASAFAFLWARRNDPDLTPLSLHPDEQHTVADARRLARDWTGLSTIRPCTAWQVAHTSRALAGIPAYYGAIAWSYAQLPALRRQIVITGAALEDRRRAGSSHATIATVILHEELHAAYAAAARPRLPAIPANPVAWNLDEAAVRCVESAALYTLLTGQEPAAGTLRDWLEDTQFNTQALPVLDQFNETAGPGEYLRAITEANITASRCRTADQADAAICQRIGAPPTGSWQTALTRPLSPAGS